MSGQIRLPGLAEVRRRGFEALVRELGAANALRFLHLYGVDHGDYTRDRDRWLSGLTIEQVETEIGKGRWTPRAASGSPC